VNEKQLRNLLLQHPLPDEFTAEERAWEVVRAAFAQRERVPRRRAPRRLFVVLALIGAAIGIGVSPAGSTIASWARDTVGREKVVGVPGQAALVKLPAAGRLLAVSPRGVWVVTEDGGRRFLGRFLGATWSPQGTFVAVWDDKRVVALDPNVTHGLRWSRPAPDVLGARWSPSGFRVAYVTRQALHVVVGNNTNDRRLAARVAPVLPAWRPVAQEVLAYSDPDGRLVVVDTDTRRTLWRTPRAPVPVALAWTDDARQLVALGEHELRVFADPGRRVEALPIPRGEGIATSLAVRAGTHDVAYAVFSPATGRSTVFLFDGRVSRRWFSGAGRVDDLAWSPDGQFLLVPWRAADELLFVAADQGRVLASADVTQQFDPGAAAGGGFPRIGGWCCPEPARR
jgi:hypothetical protein